MNQINVVFLYNEIMGYNIAVFKALLQENNIRIFVIKWDKNKLTPFEPNIISNRIQFCGRSEFDKESLLEFVKQKEPSILYVSGWRDKAYTYVAQYYKLRNIPVVCGLDNHWKGIARQRLLTMFSLFTIKQYFSHIFVAGIYQYEYARRLGFKKETIITGLYSCDNELFNRAHLTRKSWNKNILYIGRLASVKRIELIYNTFKKYEEQFPDWTLTIIGNGPERNKLIPSERITIIDFLDPEELIPYIRNASVFVHASKHEPWGVVIHEMACAGLPIITTDECGAASQLLIHGYNGYKFRVDDENSFEFYLLKMLNHTLEELKKMGNASYELSQQINPEIWKKKFLSLLPIE